MEALLIIGALAAGAHYMTKDDDPVQTVYSSQTTEEISNLGQTIPDKNYSFKLIGLK